MRVFPAVVGVFLDAFPEHKEEELFHLGDKIFLFFGVDLDVNDLSGMFGTKTLLFPGFKISTIAASPISFFDNNFMALMIGIFETFDALDASAVSGAIIALGD